MANRYIQRKVFLLFFLFLTGCVSWRDNRVKPVDYLPSQCLNSTLRLDLRASIKANGLSAVSQDTFSKDNTEKFLKIARNKRLFKEISTENNQADYILKINYESEDNGLAGLSIATLGIFPGISRFDETMHVELIKTKDYNVLDNFIITEKGYSIYQIILLFALPFVKSSRETYESSYHDIVENVLARVYHDIEKNNYQ